MQAIPPPFSVVLPTHLRWRQFQDEMAGIGYYQFIEKLEKDFDSCKDEIVKNLRKVMEEVLRPENFCVSYTGERESLDVVKAQAAGIEKSFV